MSEPLRVIKRDGVQGIEKKITLQASENYCKQNGLSVEKLGGLLLFYFDDSFMFAAPSDVKPDGLKNDLDTQPVPVLQAKLIDGKIEFHQTPYTNAYLR